MTPGVLLRKLGNDSELREFSHVMIDEARLVSPITLCVCVC